VFVEEAAARPTHAEQARVAAPERDTTGADRGAAATAVLTMGSTVIVPLAAIIDIARSARGCAAS